MTRPTSVPYANLFKKPFPACGFNSPGNTPKSAGFQNGRDAVPLGFRKAGEKKTPPEGGDKVALKGIPRLMKTKILFLEDHIQILQVIP